LRTEDFKGHGYCGTMRRRRRSLEREEAGEEMD